MVITADERMNAILVQASRADRTTIENYLKVIDAEETPDAGAAKPLTVTLRNAKAARIEQMLRTVFKRNWERRAPLSVARARSPPR